MLNLVHFEKSTNALTGKKRFSSAYREPPGGARRVQRTSDTGPRAAELNGQVGSDGCPPLQGQRFAVLADRAKWLYLTVQQGEWYHGCPVKAIYRLSSLKVFALKDGSLFVCGYPFRHRYAMPAPPRGRLWAMPQTLPHSGKPSPWGRWMRVKRADGRGAFLCTTTSGGQQDDGRYQVRTGVLSGTRRL